jgi:hypothetical protein
MTASQIFVESLPPALKAQLAEHFKNPSAEFIKEMQELAQAACKLAVIFSIEFQNAAESPPEPEAPLFAPTSREAFTNEYEPQAPVKPSPRKRR